MATSIPATASASKPPEPSTSARDSSAETRHKKIVVKGGQGGQAAKIRLHVTYETAFQSVGGALGAHLIRVDDRGQGRFHIEGQLTEEEKMAVAKAVRLPVIKHPLWRREPRWLRTEAGAYRRVAYERHHRVGWMGGRYGAAGVVSVWKPERGATRGDAANGSSPGEEFAQIVTPAAFERQTFPPQDLPPLGRAFARKALTQRPGEVQVCRFVKRTNGALRRMCFRYDGPRHDGTRPGDTGRAKGTLQVRDLDARAPRKINLDGVRTLGAEDLRECPSLREESSSHSDTRFQKTPARAA